MRSKPPVNRTSEARGSLMVQDSTFPGKRSRRWRKTYCPEIYHVLALERAFSCPVGRRSVFARSSHFDEEGPEMQRLGNWLRKKDYPNAQGCDFSLLSTTSGLPRRCCTRKAGRQQCLLRDALQYVRGSLGCARVTVANPHLQVIHWTANP